MKKEKAFTLIELIVVLVILAIIALIVTPIILNIIDKAKVSANKRSIDAYGKSIELAMSTYKLEHGKFTYDINDLKIEYSGNKVECDDITLNENGSVFITKCKIDGEYVEDEKTDDGYYQYGKIIPDYIIGDIVTYNGMEFYVINNSKTSIDYLTLLKVEPLSVDEVNIYGGVGTSNNHVNRYTDYSIGTASDSDGHGGKTGYGGMAYYTSETCGYVNGSWVETGCTTDYAQSEVKYVVDAWAQDRFKSNDLSIDATGYRARLILYDDLIKNLGYESRTDSTGPSANGITPDWIYNSNYWYWTMSQYNDCTSRVWHVSIGGYLYNADIFSRFGSVRPVINLKKSAIEE